MMMKKIKYDGSKAISENQDTKISSVGAFPLIDSYPVHRF